MYNACEAEVKTAHASNKIIPAKGRTKVGFITTAEPGIIQSVPRKRGLTH